MSFFDLNKNILIKKYPGLFEELISNNGDDSYNDIKIEITPTGDPALCVNGVYAHSPRDPVREADRLIKTFHDDASAVSHSSVVVLGFGLGYAALAAASLGRPIIIVEKRRELLLKAFELIDFSGFLSNNSLIFIIGNAEGIINALDIACDIIHSKDSAADSRDTGGKLPPFVIRNRTLISLDEQWYKNIEDKIRIWTMRDDVNAATHKKFGQRWVRNLSRNIQAIRGWPGVSRLEGLALKTEAAENSVGGFSEENLPVFLAAAGPSLDKIKPMLRDIYDRCIIVAVDTNLRFFIKNGIQPDFVLVIDPQFWNCRHLDRCSCDQINTSLIAESAVYPPVLSLPFKNKFLCGSLFPFGTFIEKQVDPKGRLGAGGSVATTAWDFARTLFQQRSFCGGVTSGSRSDISCAGEIWIAGLDLAFPELKTHFRGARFEEQSNSQSNRFSPVEKWVVRALRDGFPFKAPSACGGQVLTDRRLSLYAAWFENQFNQNPQIKNYAFFQEGLAIKGLVAANMERFLSLPKRRAGIDRRIQERFLRIENEFNDPDEKQKRALRFDAAVSSLKKGLTNIKNAAEEGAEIARRALRFPLNEQQQNRILKELDDITRRVTESEVKEVAGFLFPPAAENDEDSGEKDKFRAYLKSSQKLFTGIKNAAALSFYGV